MKNDINSLLGISKSLTDYVKAMNQVNRATNIHDLLGSINKPLESIIKTPASVQFDYFKPIFSQEFFKAMAPINKQNEIMKIVLGGTTQTSIFRNLTDLAVPNKDKLMHSILPVLKVKETVENYLGVYQQQQSLASQLSAISTSKLFVSGVPSSVLAAQNYIEHKPLTGYDVIYGSEFVKTLENMKHDTKEISNVYKQAELLLKDPDFTEEIAKFQATAITIDGERNIDEKKYKVWHVKYFAEFYLVKWIKEGKCSPSVAYVILGLLSLYFLYHDGKAIYEDVNKVVELINGEEKQIAIEAFEKYTIPAREISDFVISKTPIYWGNSTKTKKIGFIKKGAYVFILRTKAGWCYVEGRVTITMANNRTNRKKYKTKSAPQVVKEVVRGWVETKFLDSYNF